MPVPPKITPWGRNPIDAFIGKRLAQAGFEPSQEASKEKWLRRVSFDLTGLPPDIVSIRTFLADQSPEAWETVVNALLDSDAAAERLTGEWLDVARYSDSYGFQVDKDRSVWPWRDWVIRAFRQNMPYDQFVIEQLAGDLLQQPSRDQILATTFNRLHPQESEGGSVPEEYRVEYVSDRLHTYGTAFLGLTMECSRCHDHKYDPISTREYYELSAFFANIDESGLYSFFTPSVPTPTLWLPTEAQEQHWQSLKGELEHAVAELRSVEASVEEHQVFQAWCRDHEQHFPPEPVADFAFDEWSDNASPNRFNPDRPATTTSNNVPVEGKQGRAILLSGDDGVNLHTGDFSRDDVFSISLWLWTPEVKERAVVFSRSKAWTDAASRGYELLLEAGRLSVALIHYEPGNALRVRAKEVLATQRWQHLTLTYDGSSRAEGVKVYLNGEDLALEVVRDQLSREITGGGSDAIVLGERMRDSGFKGGKIDEFRLYDRELTPQEARAVFTGEPFAPDFVTWQRRHSLVWREAQSHLDTLRRQRTALAESISEIMVMEESGEPRQSYVLDRGLYSERSVAVSPATPAVLHPFPEHAPRNRLGLARWTVDAANPLTARVTVNRYWQMLFGTGLVSTSEDFGSQGRVPSHPELLDWLARDLMDHGWDLRRLLSQIVLSATYRQASSMPGGRYGSEDPENIWLYRYPAPRLTAEMMRDNALAVSGLLVPALGGPPVKPYDIELAFVPSPPDPAPGLYRRSLYTYWKQTGPSPLMTTLNASKREVCRVRLEKPESPLQGLVLLNGPQFVEAARVLASRLVETHGESREMIATEAFLLLTSREPDVEERRILIRLLAEQEDYYAQHPVEAVALLSSGSAPSPVGAGPVLARKAAATQLVSTLMNLEECLSKR